jgi:hypothetical protein
MPCGEAPAVGIDSFATSDRASRRARLAAMTSHTLHAAPPIRAAPTPLSQDLQECHMDNSKLSGETISDAAQSLSDLQGRVKSLLDAQRAYLSQLQALEEQTTSDEDKRELSVISALLSQAERLLFGSEQPSLIDADALPVAKTPAGDEDEAPIAAFAKMLISTQKLTKTVEKVLQEVHMRIDLLAVSPT